MNRRAALAWAIVLAGCGDRELPPYGETVIEVDTDLPVPRLASRLRVDLYAPNGDWYESRDTALPDPRDWPASFSVFSRAETSERSVLVRLRAYAHGSVRDYRGERFLPRPDAEPADEIIELPEATDQPRLVIDGVDATPSTEPEPNLSVDRLLSISLEPEQRRKVRVTLRGACIGTMADVVGQETCVDAFDQRVPAPAAPLEEPGAASAAGGFGAEIPCTAAPRPGGTAPDGTPLFDEEVCVPGGAFVFGSALVFGAAEQSGRPERAALVSPFRIDRYEVTVARWRQALAAGFVTPQLVIPNEGPLGQSSASAVSLCTWSSTPQGRETHALSCVGWLAARAFCHFIGAELPTEVQWEYAATAAARSGETLFAWGEAAPTCARAIYGRWDDDLTGGIECEKEGFGPQPVDARDGEGEDVAVGGGVVGLGGGMTEWLLDSFQPLGSRCWRGATLQDPVCWQDTALSRAGRGGSWFDQIFYLRAPLRLHYGSNDAGVGIGFRCARPGVE